MLTPELLARLVWLEQPEEERAERGIAAHAAFGLINSTPHSGKLPDARMREVLRTMALGALGLRVQVPQ